MLTIGDYVQDQVFGHRGRVKAIHARCPEGAVWLSQQADAETRKLIHRPWVSVLVHGGGSVVRPVDRLREIEVFDFRNPWAEHYFGEED